MSVALNWNWQKVCKSYHKFLVSKMKCELKLNLSHESDMFEYSIENDGMFSFES